MMHVRTDVALLVSLLSGAHAFALAPAASPSTVGVNVRAAASMAALPATTDDYEWATFQFDENGKAKAGWPEDWPEGGSEGGSGR